ncbi:efflux RND transporter permease subunit [Sedimentisphaera salicampi]|uniref:Efflux transporter, putative, hydrophobe/amphiphile efflux-3 (HAE3) family n=1 Tax=Sedimentisphaera salicampi TaxID=1941349 RepID=A0A1W6LL15_9BACT|nr:MMPL family transporter [Sedimentisphaera salicampi]ARN56443.1 efflux transporter, putative, hydrophobe/amphiphile efflux-3 (HAE3) family [Sedimentisphaera salicampi]OXU15331.1 efflux transporter, putative, hydrophobe/amphiphile efflux-3 (HAE3) family [Sedimentisphaera salicampi]
MNFREKLTEFSLHRHKVVTALVTAVTILSIVLAAGPSVFPNVMSGLNKVKIDTDPENMLPDDEPVRVLHNEMKDEFTLHDMVVVGVVNEEHPQGVFNTETLKNVYELTEYIKTLTWEENGEQEGVVKADLIAPSTVDNIEQGGLGTVHFEWLMPAPPETPEEAQAIREKASDIPFLDGTLVSEDGKALGIYIPITKKDLSYKVYSSLNEKIETFSGSEKYHITGLPVAEDTFGVEMFKQMAISAPTAMVVIFIIMLIFFRKLHVIVSPMIVALVSVVVTMGALIISGFPVHIMSSMIPIFIMPIAVLDSIHIISEFFEIYQKHKDRKKTMHKVMEDLFVPMLYTSLTSAAGFASLALTPIPPVQVFGVFVAIGIMVAWFLTITFIPAYVMHLKPETLHKFGRQHDENGFKKDDDSILGRWLGKHGIWTYNRTKLILTATAVVVAISIYGISKIEINDNPVKWFEKEHPIREADRVLNEHFGGTYMAYLALESKEGSPKEAAEKLAQTLKEKADAKIKQYQQESWPEAVEVFKELKASISEQGETAKSPAGLLESLKAENEDELSKAEGEMAFALDEASLFINEAEQLDDTFKDPEVLEYIEDLQVELADTGVVGKSNSVTDIVKTVHRELFEGKESEFKVPDTPQAVAQCMLTYQSSHRPGDLWHFVTPDYKKSSLWVQLKSGDNKDMTKVVDEINDYIADNPPPKNLEHHWYGLTYINVIWQKKMVNGMLEAFAGSFIVVFLMMALLFRSPLWGLMSMIPLTITIVAIYGGVGLVGKDYDMPVAVLSSMTLGLAIDFAIHFLARTRALYPQFGNSWKKTVPAVFAEPALAITRNIIVLAVGFLPLILAPLTPYKTVGILLATILSVSGVGTLLLLPALVRVFEKRLFKNERKGELE